MKRRDQLPPLAAAIEIADIRLASDGDHGLLVAILGVRSGVCFLAGVAGRSSGGNGQERGDQDRNKIETSVTCAAWLREIQGLLFTSFMLTSVDEFEN